MNQLPHDIKAEQALLGACIANNELLADLKIETTDFFSTSNRIIWTQMQELRSENMAIDEVTLINSLEKNNMLKRAGGDFYIMDLYNNCPIVENVPHYEKILIDAKRSRDMLEISREVQGMVNQNQNHNDIKDYFSKMIKIADSRGGDDSGISSFEETLINASLILEKRSDGQELGFTTGLTDLDNAIHGARKGKLIVIAARPSMGKTALALSMGMELSKQLPVFMMSMEMTPEELMLRVMSNESSVDFGKMFTGDLDGDEWDRVMAMAIDKANSPFRFLRKPTRTLSYVRNMLLHLKKTNPEFVFIMDYLQLMTTSSSANRDTGIGEISRELKGLCQDLEIPIILLAQLNRQVESRPNKRPIMSDLRESGQIEQDADHIIMIYRDEIYNEGSKDKGIAELILVKNRDGEVGTIRVAFQGFYQRFANLSLYR